MANRWFMSDAVLGAVLSAWLDSVVDDDDWSIHLYKNPHNPVPGDVLSNYDECDFPGYVQGVVVLGDFGSPVVTGNVATSTNSTVNTFTGAGGTWSPQIVYGYFLLDGADNLVGAEAFVNPRVMNPGDELAVVPRIQEANIPATS